MEVLESGSDAKVGVGSAFVGDSLGHLVTNYHVIARVVQAPSQHEARVTVDGRSVAVQVLAVDLVNDLAVLTPTGAAPSLVLAPRDEAPPQGARVLALGHPQDLGLAIVEGTYNGFVEHAAVPRLHFTGAINPGMSGGPAVLDDGQLVGVNVSTLGEEIGFLVPAAAVRALLARVPSTPPSTTALRTAMAAQLSAAATASLQHLFAAGTPTALLGDYRVPTLPDTSFRCWGDTQRPDNLRLERIEHQCSMQEQIFLSETLSAGFARFTHQVVKGPARGSLRQFDALQSLFSGEISYDGERREVTSFRCTDANRTVGSLTWRTALCVRRLRDLPGLYEAVLRAVVLGRRDAGLTTTLSLSGVPFALVQTLPDRFLTLVGRR